MLTVIFKAVLLMSAAGGALTLALLALRPITSKLFGPTWQYYIWLAVLLAMIVPVTISPAAPIGGESYNAAPAPVQVLEPVAPQSEIFTAENQPNVSAQNNLPYVLPAEAKEISVDVSLLIEKLMLPLAAIWFIGAVLALMVRMVKYSIFLNTVKHGIKPVELPDFPCEAYETRLMDAPLVVGLLRPRLLLPTELSTEDLAWVMRHELVHIKRRDLLFKWFAMAVSCVHWFNPLAYIALRQIDKWCEISCDAAVVCDMDQSLRSGYMRTILGMLRGSRGMALTTGMGGGKKFIKHRFSAIRSAGRVGKSTLVLSVITAAVLMVVTLLGSGTALGRIIETRGMEQGSELYTNPAMNFVLELPENWRGKYYVEATDSSVYFRHNASGENLFLVERAEGVLNIVVFDNPDDFSETVMYDGGYTYIIKDVSLSDMSVVWTNTDRAEYNSMLKDIDFVKSSVRPIIAHYMGKSYDASKLSRETLNWLSWFNSLSEEAQLAVDFVPHELIENVSTEAVEPYFNEELGFSMEISGVWLGNYTAVTENDVVYFYQRKTYEKYGFGMLFYVRRAQTPSAIVYEGIAVQGSDGEPNYIIGYPTDVHCPVEDEELSAEYKKMMAEAEVIKATIRPLASASDKAKDGIYVYTSARMKYDDQQAGISLDIQPGIHFLSRQEADKVFSFRRHPISKISTYEIKVPEGALIKTPETPGRPAIIKSDIGLEAPYVITQNSDGEYIYMELDGSFSLNSYDPVSVLEIKGSKCLVVVEYGDFPRLYGTVDSSSLSYGFDMALPVSGKIAVPFSTDHALAEISVAKNAPVYAAATGTVTEEETEYGRYIKIDHGNGVVTSYAGLSETVVSGGMGIKRGELIGYCGNSDGADAPYLHFGVTVGGEPFDPERYLIFE